MQSYVEFGLRNPGDYRFVFMLKPPVEKRPYKVHGAFEVLRNMVRRCVEREAISLRRRGDRGPRAMELRSRNYFAPHTATCVPWVSKKKLIGHVIDAGVDKSDC